MPVKPNYQTLLETSPIVYALCLTLKDCPVIETSLNVKERQCLTAALYSLLAGKSGENLSLFIKLFLLQSVP